MKRYPEVCGDKCRGLTSGEITMIHAVFGNALNLSAIGVHNHPHPRKTGDLNRSHGADNGLFMVDDPNASFPDYFADYTTAPIYQQATVIHELAHIWQQETGRKGVYPHNEAMEVLKAVEKESGEVKKLSDVTRAYQNVTGRRQTHDVIGRNLATNPIQYPDMHYTTTMKWTDVEGRDRQRQTVHAQPEVRLSDQYAHAHNSNGAKAAGNWKTNADYDYLYSSIDWRDGWKAFDGLNYEAQAEMIKDYFLLSKGIDPSSPLACGPGMHNVPTMGKPRLPLIVYKLVIPFLRGRA